MATKKKPKSKTPKILYTIKDKHLPDGKIEVLESANAWWIDRTKVDEMVKGLKMGMKWGEVQVLCGITERQRKYFFEIHPALLSAFQELPKYQNILFRQALHKKLENGNWDAVRFFGERKIPDEFKEKKEVDLKKPLLIDDIIN